MSAKIIDGKFFAGQIAEEIKAAVSEMKSTGRRPPCLAVIMAGNDPASQIYTNSKKNTCEAAGIESLVYKLPTGTPQETLIELIDMLNADDSVDGILLQSPLPKGMDEAGALLRINPAKDLDGLHPQNTGLLAEGGAGLLPCAAAGVIELLKHGGVDIEGARAVVLGRSNVVGKPVAMLLLRENATVTICHSKTRDIAEITRTADIVVAAVGKKGFVTPDMIKEGAAVIDVGIHRIPGSRKVYGDVDPACAEKAGYITPVPGGVGPMTVAVLMKNCLAAYNMRGGNE